MNKEVTYTVNNMPYNCKIEGEVEFGESYRMIDGDQNLIEDLNWDREGFSVVNFLTPTDMGQLKSAVKEALTKIIFEVTGSELNNLEDYHRVVDDQDHRAVTKFTYNRLFFDELGFDVGIIEKRISNLIGRSVTAMAPNGADSKVRLLLRIVRPNKPDNNPFHRDVWLDRLRNCVNIYMPLWGSNENSSLPLVPGSHYWRESDIERTKAGSKVDGIQFTVPAVTATRYGLSAIRPNPAQDEVLVFSPYLTHCGGKNLSSEQTRLSLEMRFWER